MKSRALILMVCLLPLLQACFGYNDIKGAKVYTLQNHKRLDVYTHSTSINVSLSLDSATYRIGSSIKFHLTYCNSSQDTVRILPYPKVYLEAWLVDSSSSANHLPFPFVDMLTQPDTVLPGFVHISLADTIDLFKSAILSPGSSFNCTYVLRHSQRYFRAGHKYRLQLMCINTVYRMGDTDYLSGIFKPNAVIAQFL